MSSETAVSLGSLPAVFAISPDGTVYINQLVSRSTVQSPVYFWSGWISLGT